MKRHNIKVDFTKHVYHRDLAAVSGSAISRVTVAKSVRVPEAGRVSLEQVKSQGTLLITRSCADIDAGYRRRSNRAASKDGIVHPNE